MYLCRVAVNHGVIRYIFGDHGTRADKRVFPDGVAANYGGVSADGSTSLYRSRQVIPPLRPVPPGHFNVGENTGWTAEDIILKSNPLVYGDIVL